MRKAGSIISRMTTIVAGDQFRDKQNPTIDTAAINGGWLKWHGYKEPNRECDYYDDGLRDCRPHRKKCTWSWCEPEPSAKAYLTNTKQALKSARVCRLNPNEPYSDWDCNLHILDAEYWLEKAERFIK